MNNVRIEGYVYLFRMGEHHKIGSSRNPGKRMIALATGPYECIMVHSFPSAHCREVEKGLHSHFKSVRVRGEWFLLLPEDVARIKELGRTDAAADLPDGLRPAESFRVADINSFAHRLYSLREAAGLTQEQLAEKIESPRSAISHLEEGRVLKPQRKTLKALAAALGCSVEQLTGGKS